MHLFVRGRFCAILALAARESHLISGDVSVVLCSWQFVKARIIILASGTGKTQQNRELILLVSAQRPRENESVDKRSPTFVRNLIGIRHSTEDNCNESLERSWCFEMNDTF
jgi:hypothetical protein